jgi:hypothetical protein
MLYAALALLALFASCSTQQALSLKETQIAILADVHLQDVYGAFEDNDYKGVPQPQTGVHALIRTMQSQLESTRIFNENYFAFLAALEDIAKRNITYVILPGDFSDDGQAVHIRGLKRILDEYASVHGISFFMITGNHDVIQPFDHHDGKEDFLGTGGKAQPIASVTEVLKKTKLPTHPPILTKDMQNLGYDGLARLLGDFGFFPKEEYHYWATPFSDYTYANYTYSLAKAHAPLAKRSHTYATNHLPLPDLSYVVEPAPGIWLLALDANTYIEGPGQSATNDSDYPNNGLELGNLLGPKKYLMDWLKRVIKEAKKQNKLLIAFSHYPLLDFNDGASPEINELLVGGKMQLKRMPSEQLGEVLADAGLTLHLGGHMHMNDTGVHTSKKGNTLINIQTPSLAAYMPAYKLLQIQKPGKINVRTITIDSVQDHRAFFDLYAQEHAFLETLGAENIWNKDVLASKDYHGFMTWHLKELVRLRFLKSEWPPALAHFLMNITGEELFFLAQSKDQENFETQLNALRQDRSASGKQDMGMHKNLGVAAETLATLGTWTGEDLIFDLYRLRSADELAFADIGTDRLQEYKWLIASFLTNHPKQGQTTDPMRDGLVQLMVILEKFMTGAPSDHFELDLDKGSVKRLPKNY